MSEVQLVTRMLCLLLRSWEEKTLGATEELSEKVPGLIYWLGAADPDEFENARKEGRQMPSLHSPFFKPNATVAIPIVG